MFSAPKYEVNLYLKGRLVGDVRPLAEGLKWARRRTMVGVDSIDFTLNDQLFHKWAKERGYSIKDLLKPYALECRLVRDGVGLVGGFLATMPSYSPLNASASLDMAFDGYLNLLDGVIIRNQSNNLPRGTVSGKAGTLIKNQIDFANTMSGNAGANYGLTAKTIDDMASITETFDNYKTVKAWICERADNSTGAGKFDVYFYPDKSYDIKKDANFGQKITDWTAEYPMKNGGASATSISASEVGGFASAVFGLGSGEVSPDAKKNTAIRNFNSNRTKASEFGYVETLYQDSSITKQATLNNNVSSTLKNLSNFMWSPEITLHGRQVAPKPDGEKKIWIGDTITVKNSQDLTGLMDGQFRVMELDVDVSPAGDETIKPKLERV